MEEARQDNNKYQIMGAIRYKLDDNKYICILIRWGVRISAKVSLFKQLVDTT